jgi:molecular chaperone DnaK (HSP70)
MKKIAIDFGTTNTVVAVWREATSAPETVRLPGLSAPGEDGLPPLVPSLLYVVDGAHGDVNVGQSVRAGGYDVHGDERFFASFKRGIAATNRPLARTIDGASWDDACAGTAFLRKVLSAVLEVEGEQVDELVLSVPIQSFERYLKWLRDEAFVTEWGGRRLRVVDESTAAALGYEVRTPGEMILVFDFGGGTLDVSLVRMPIAEEGSGVVIEANKSGPVDRLAGDGYVEARVIAKAGRVLGGDDIDHWLLDELLARHNVDRREVGDIYSQLKLAVEAAKIRLSTYESAEISVFDPDTYRTFRATLTRSQFEEMLDRREFFGAIQKTVDKVLRGARAKGIYPEDIGAVLMVGGTSLIPSVRRMVRTMFGSERVSEHKPFEAVAHGALGLAVGLGVEDFLYHSYGVRHLSPITGRHEWEEIIPAGVRYPLDEPVKLVLTASREGQEALELVVGEVEESAGGITEVMFGDRAILMVEGGLELRRVVPLNEEDGARTVAFLEPPGKAGEDRVEVVFDVDQNRTLRVTVLDLLTKKELLHSVPVVELH